LPINLVGAGGLADVAMSVIQRIKGIGRALMKLLSGALPTRRQVVSLLTTGDGLSRQR